MAEDPAFQEDAFQQDAFQAEVPRMVLCGKITLEPLLSAKIELSECGSE